MSICVDRDDERHAGRPRVVDRLDRLRHDAVVGRDDQHDDVGGLHAAGAHGGERLVARRVQEEDFAPGGFDLGGGDVLRDAAEFAFDDLAAAVIVEDRGLAVVDVAHDRDDRRPRVQVFFAVLAHVLFDVGFVPFQADLQVDVALDRQLFGQVQVHELVDRDGLALEEGGFDDLGRGRPDLLGKLADGERAGDDDRTRDLGRSFGRVAAEFGARARDGRDRPAGRRGPAIDLARARLLRAAFSASVSAGVAPRRPLSPPGGVCRRFELHHADFGYGQDFDDRFFLDASAAWRSAAARSPSGRGRVRSTIAASFAHARFAAAALGAGRSRFGAFGRAGRPHERRVGADLGAAGAVGWPARASGDSSRRISGAAE